MRKRDLLSILLIFCTVSLSAQKGTMETKGDTIPAAEYTFKVNNISALLRANSNHFYKGSSHYFAPADSTTTTIFANALWVGGLDDDDSVHVAAMRYGVGDDFWTGPLSTVDASIDVTQRVKWNKFWLVERQDIMNFIESNGQIISNSILAWPAHGDTTKGEPFHIAPFFDRNKDGIYDPHNGDYPLIYGDKCVFFVFNDNYGAHTETGGKAIGMEVHAMAYGFNAPGHKGLHNTLFMNYKLINRSSTTYHDTYVGIWTDLDIGDPHDDYLGCDVARGTYYAANGDSIDGNGLGQPWAYIANPPLQAVTILGGPYMNPNDKDDPLFDDFEIDDNDEYCYQYALSETNQFAINGVNFGDGIKDNERIGMSYFLYNQVNNGVTGDPATDKNFYDLLHGVWKDGVSMKFGGNGHPSQGANGPNCRFMFPSHTDRCDWGTRAIDPDHGQYGPAGWTFDSAGNVPTDVRGLASMGPFTFRPGATHEIDFAFVTIFPKDSGANPMTLFEDCIDTIIKAYRNGVTAYGQQFLTVGIKDSKPPHLAANITVFPNPTSDAVTLRLEDDMVKMGVLEMYDIYGKLILREKINENLHKVNMQNRAPGLYLLKVYSINQEYIGTYKVVKR